MQEVEIAVDSDRMIGRMFFPEGAGPFPGCLVAHEAPGLGEHVYNVAARMARLGFAAFALDYQGGGAALSDMDEVGRRIENWLRDPAPIRRRLRAAYHHLTSRPEVDETQIVGLGYCYGGTAMLELARTGVALKAVVGFHAGLTVARPSEAANIRARVLLCAGAQDPLVPASDRQAFEEEMTAAGVDWQIIVFGRSAHGFTNPAADALKVPGVRYDAAAAASSWRAMEDFIRETTPFRVSRDDSNLISDLTLPVIA